MRGRWRALVRWWRAAGNDAQLGAVVSVVAIVIGATCAGVQLYGDDPPQQVPPAVQQPQSQAPQGPRLEFAVTLPAYENNCTSAWIVPRTVADKTPYDPREVPADGTLGTGGVIEFVAQETTGRTVVLHSIRAEVKARGPAVTGSLLRHSGCGGELTRAKLTTDLGDAAGKVMPRDPKQTLFPWTIAENDPVAYSVEAHTAQGRVEFVLVLEWSWGGKRERTVVDNGGKPFVISSVEGAVMLCTGTGTFSRGHC